MLDARCGSAWRCFNREVLVTICWCCNCLLLGVQKETEQKRSLVKATAGKQVWVFFLCPSVLIPLCIFFIILFKSAEIPRLRVWERTEAGAKAHTGWFWSCSRRLSPAVFSELLIARAETPSVAFLSSWVVLSCTALQSCFSSTGHRWAAGPWLGVSVPNPYAQEMLLVIYLRWDFPFCSAEEESAITDAWFCFGRVKDALSEMKARLNFSERRAMMLQIRLVPNRYTAELGQAHPEYERFLLAHVSENLYVGMFL